MSKIKGQEQKVLREGSGSRARGGGDLRANSGGLELQWKEMD